MGLLDCGDCPGATVVTRLAQVKLWNAPLSERPTAVHVAVSEDFEAQTFSNFFRFPMLFLCGLFFPIAKLPALLLPLSYALPLTYGADLLRGGIVGGNALPYALDFAALLAFCLTLFAASLWNVRRRWIA